ncbi:DUF4395 family protein [Nonomuraea salmonea]|uniref:DUF4395 family protein n=2 Tax=Nonomuraea salmonea TaxID=46181 RepID=A0ABV5NR70_9ACTN
MRADPRMLRFGAAVITQILASALISESLRLLAVRALSRALGAFRRSPQMMLRPAPGAGKDPGLVRPVLAVVGPAGFAAVITPQALSASAAATLAAFLIAACGFCLGCAMYLLIRRLLPAANMEVSQ